MAYSVIEYVGDGTTKTFSIPFKYLDQTHIKVFVDGAEKPFSFLSPSVVTLSTTPASGTTVRLSRNTQADTRIVDFKDGAVLNETDMDLSAEQVFLIAQEAVDAVKESLYRSVDGLYDAQGRRIKNVAAPVNDTDAANKQWVVAQTAASVEAAASSATAAAGFASSASDSLDAADAAVAEAEAFKNTAQTLADSSADSAAESLAAKLDVLGALAAAKLPASLIGKARQFLQIKADESGYELVSSVAAPKFFGVKKSADGTELLLTTGSADMYDSAAFDGWMLSENITLAVVNNNLVVVLP